MSGRQDGWSTDQRLALRTAVARLQGEFGEHVDNTTIVHVLLDSHDRFTGDSAITWFLRAECFARQRLRVLARVLDRHAGDTPAALFLGVHDAGRSPMALGFFRHFAGDRAVAWSGGSEPGDEINPAVLAAMRDRGIDLTREFPKPLTSEILQAADVVITMGGDTWPRFSDKHYLDWDIEDPASLRVEDIRSIRDQIERRVRGLLNELGVAART